MARTATTATTTSTTSHAPRSRLAAISRPLSTRKRGSGGRFRGLGGEAVGQGEELGTHRRGILVAEVGETAVLVVTGSRPRSIRTSASPSRRAVSGATMSTAWTRRSGKRSDWR